MEKEQIILTITNEMSNNLTNYQLELLKNVLIVQFKSIEITILTDELKKKEEQDTNEKYINSFISAKEIEGCSKRTIKYYKENIDNLIIKLDKPIRIITTEDVRMYLSDYKESNKCSSVTIDNLRRIYSSFFAWLEDEDYIIKSPVRRIHRIKTATLIKETFTDENIEIMRDDCKLIRDLVIIELLYSTGIRVGELVNLNKADINFEDRSCVVQGKGNKQREVYFDARTKIHLKQYLDSRVDNNDALFVSKNKPYQRLSISGIERIVRNIGIDTNINRVHPHKFRRTLATMAIDKGMPIEQVQKLLGHVKIETTMHYAMVNQNNVKNSHRKYIG
ncbi:MAG: tyrosine-type recombinase/integrase [Clostridia bacterium]|nr:tyrosine-type recombinase/integrase [Clostridia bacterium]